MDQELLLVLADRLLEEALALKDGPVPFFGVLGFIKEDCAVLVVLG